MSGTIENVTLNEIKINFINQTIEKVAIGLYAGIIEGKSIFRNNWATSDLKI